MAKPELEFFPTDDIASVPVADARLATIRRILTEDPQRMFVTRMLKVDPGCASTETFVMTFGRKSIFLKAASGMGTVFQEGYVCLPATWHETRPISYG